MSLSLEQKQAMVAEVASKLAGAQAVIVAEYRGLDVGARDAAAREGEEVGLVSAGAEEHARAPRGQGYAVREAVRADGRSADVRHRQDPVAGAKVLSEFAKENELFVISGGAMPNSLMSAKDVKALALLPSREELLAKLAGHHAGADRQAGAHDERGARASSSGRSPPCATRKEKAGALNTDIRNLIRI